MSGRLSKCLTIWLAIGASAAPLRAQGTNDPVTGTWSGYIGKSEANPSSVKVELKLAPDGTLSGKVSGPEINPGDVGSGTFDRTTGMIKFTVVVREANWDRGANVSFEGRVVRDSAFGKLTLGGETGVFRLSRGSPTSGAPARPTNGIDAEIRRAFIEVSDRISRAAEMVPAEKYAYRPVSGVRTFAQLVGHIVDGATYYCGRAAGRGDEWSEATEKQVTTKAALQQKLKQALAGCSAAYDGAGQAGPLVANVSHASLHYGNLVTYIRMLGLTPPSS